MILGIAISACAIMEPEMRQGKSGMLTARARLNTIAAARIALGELQTAMGPDRRICANAELTDGDGEIRHRLWCGVWRTDRLRSDPPTAEPFVHRDALGGLMDDRHAANATRSHVRRRECLAWLVSGIRPDPFARTNPDLDRVRPESGTPGAVEAPAEHDGLGGRIAWWIADENQKHCVRSRPPKRSENPGTTNTSTGLALLGGWRADGAAPRIPPPTLESLVAEGLIASAPLHALADTVTLDTHRVAADVRRGGLCRDLTPYLTEMPATDLPKDTDPILDDAPPAGVFATHGPRFGMLKSWARLGNSATLSPQAGSRHASESTKPATLFHDGTHANLPDAAAPRSPVIAPVLTEAAVYVRLSTDPARRNAGDAPWLRMHLHPRVVLWNPYATPMGSARYLVHLRVNGSPVFRLVKAAKTITGAITGWRVYTPALVNYATTQGTLLFVIDCPRMEPGECMLFQPATTAPLYGKTPGNPTYAPLANRLTRATTLSHANFYLEDSDAFEDRQLAALAGLKLDQETWRRENAAAEDYAVALKWLPSPGPATWSELRGAPTLRYLSGSLKCGAGTTPAAGWPANTAAPLTSGLEEAPPARSRDGMRMRRFFETPANRAAYSPAAHMDVAPLADLNPLAVFQFAHPLANRGLIPTASDRRVDKFGLFTRDEPDSETDWRAYATTDIAAHPFGTPARFKGCRTTVVAGVPAPPESIRSIAEFTHAPFAPHEWHPLGALGESRITPASTADRTVADANACDFHTMPASIRDALRIAEAPESPRVFDLRYELNHALWDRYVCFGGNAARRREFTQSGALHPEFATDLTLTNTESGHLLNDGDCSRRGAAALTIGGAFNVNSVNVAAWKQLLAESRGRAPGLPEYAAYPRFAHRPGEPLTKSPRETEPGFGDGYRLLADTELDRLASAIVDEVKRRGPFLSLSDFINRSLSAEPMDTHPDRPSANACGALQAAIDRAEINSLTRDQRGLISRDAAIPNNQFLGAHQSHSRFEGGGGILTQADLLKSFGHKLTVRGDSFVITAVGTAGEGPNALRLCAYITVKRSTKPIKPSSENPEEPEPATENTWGRRFEVTQWRWADQ